MLNRLKTLQMIRTIPLDDTLDQTNAPHGAFHGVNDSFSVVT